MLSYVIGKNGILCKGGGTMAKDKGKDKDKKKKEKKDKKKAK